MNFPPSRTLYADRVILLVSVIILIIDCAIHFDFIEIQKDKSIIDVISWFNIYFLALALFYFTKLSLKQDVMLSFPNSFIFFGYSRYSFFIMECKNLIFNPQHILLNITSFYLIISLNYYTQSFVEVSRLFILFMLQFYAVSFFFLLLRNFFEPNRINLLSIFLFIQIFNSLANILKEPLFYLNPLYGWLLAPELFQLSDSIYILFVSGVIGIFYLLNLIAKKIVKWSV